MRGLAASSTIRSVKQQGFDHTKQPPNLLAARPSSFVLAYADTATLVSLFACSVQEATLAQRPVILQLKKMFYSTKSHTLSPYQETQRDRSKRLCNTGYQHSFTPVPARSIPKTATGHLSDQDASAILDAVRSLKADIPPVVVKHAISAPPKSVELFIFLLHKVQQGIDVDWLSNVILSEDPNHHYDTFGAEFNPNVHRQSSTTSRNSRTSALTGTTAATGSQFARRGSRQHSIHHSIAEDIDEDFSVPETPFSHALDDFAGTSGLADLDPLVTNIMSNALQSTHHLLPLPSSQGPGIVAHHEYHMNAELEHAPFFNFDDFSTDPQLVAQANHTPRLEQSGQSSYYAPQAHICDQESYTATLPSSDSVSNAVNVHGIRSAQSAHFGRSSEVQKDKTPLDFVSYAGPQPRKLEARALCPRCIHHEGFVLPNELRKHMVAKHDKAIAFSCAHPGCRHESFNLHHAKRHHTSYHQGCETDKDKDAVQMACIVKTAKGLGTRMWGCWYCIWAHYDVDEWARHQLSKHKGAPREGMSFTCLIHSLLSQEKLKFWWDQAVERLQDSTGYTWDLKWSEGHDTRRDEMIRQLGTGFCGNTDFFEDASACQTIVTEATDTAIPTSVQKHPLPDNGKRPPTSSPNGFRQHRSFCRNLSLRSQKSKPNLKQDIPAMPEAQPQPTYGLQTENLSRRGILRRAGKPRPATSHGLTSSSFGMTNGDSIHSLPY